MSDWDMVTVDLILIGCSIIAAGIIIAAMLLGIIHTSQKFLLLTAIILVLMGAVVILVLDHKSGQES